MKLLILITVFPLYYCAPRQTYTIDNEADYNRVGYSGDYYEKCRYIENVSDRTGIWRSYSHRCIVKIQTEKLVGILGDIPNEICVERWIEGSYGHKMFIHCQKPTIGLSPQMTSTNSWTTTVYDLSPCLLNTSVSEIWLYLDVSYVDQLYMVQLDKIVFTVLETTDSTEDTPTTDNQEITTDYQEITTDFQDITADYPETTTFSPKTNCSNPGTYFIPYPGNCSMYMVCHNYELQDEVKMCPSGTLFDPDVGQCNREEVVHCRPQCPPFGIVKFPHSRNCTLFWLCVEGEPHIDACSQGLVFDQQTGECAPPEIVLCPNLCPPTGIANLPHATNCSLYWTCVNGDPSLQTCPPRMLFDVVISQCNLEENVEC